MKIVWIFLFCFGTARLCMETLCSSSSSGRLTFASLSTFFFFLLDPGLRAHFTAARPDGLRPPSEREQKKKSKKGGGGNCSQKRRLTPPDEILGVLTPSTRSSDPFCAGKAKIWRQITKCIAVRGLNFPGHFDVSSALHCARPRTSPRPPALARPYVVPGPPPSDLTRTWTGTSN